ncbi:hypothetical protein IE4872_PD02132 (plasmid) [Rhizobium gallicum]|uniref:Uncharacterized protein n=1 Tax=Rhizobium gallicum TaxID=56730 RepID=A0A1L5NXL4_9HYPH|nr:hypothetical protein IE4872_PD02132 [Rhizobium gallicum]
MLRRNLQARRIFQRCIDSPVHSFFEQGFAGLGQSLDAVGIVSDAVIDVVGIFLLMPAIEGVTFHGEQCRNRADGNLDTIGPAARHITGDRDQLIETQGQVRAVGPLDSEIAQDRRTVLHDLRVTWHQETERRQSYFSEIAIFNE